MGKKSYSTVINEVSSFSQAAQDQAIVAGGDLGITNNTRITEIDNGAVTGALDFAGRAASNAFDYGLDLSDSAFRFATLQGENSRASFSEAADMTLQALGRVAAVTDSALDFVSRANEKAISASTEAAGSAEKEIARAYDNANNRDFASTETLAKYAVIGAVVLGGAFILRGRA